MPNIVWVLDPIDGTRSFITGLPLWGTLIGLTPARRAGLGMMAQPFIGERFAGDGTRAWLRAGRRGGARSHARPCAPLRRGLAVHDHARSCSKTADRAAYAGSKAPSRLARYGCDCYAYCMVAAGHVDLVIEAGLKPYDIVALIPIVEGAGGVVTTWDGGSAAARRQGRGGGDKRLHAAVLESSLERDVRATTRSAR